VERMAGKVGKEIAGRIVERMAGRVGEEVAGGVLLIGGGGPVCISSSRTS
jgi:hypothetical protein